MSTSIMNPTRKLRGQIAFAVGFLLCSILLGGSSFQGQGILNEDHSTTAISMGNPAAVYCTEMGYQFEIVMTDAGLKGVCHLPEGLTCDAWKYLEGLCGQEYSYCAELGYRIQIQVDGMNPYSRVYGICVNDKNERVAAVTELFNLPEMSTGCGGETINLAPLALADIGEQYHPPKDFTTPASFDWRIYDGSDWLTPIKDQGFCGSCWAFSAVGIVEAAHNIYENNPTLDLDLSEQYLVSDCDTDSGDCCGGWKDSALAYIRDYGVPDETCLAYVDGTGCDCDAGCSVECTYNAPNVCSDRTCSDRCADWSSRLESITAYGWVDSDISTIKQALVDRGPLAVSMYYGGYWDGDVYRCTSATSTDHAVAIVGYDDAGEYWIVRNSWGASWNGDGYFKVGYGECLIEQYAYYALAFVPPPANDDFDAATVVSSMPYSTAQDTIGATNAGDDPGYSCLGDSQRYNTVWYRYTPSASGTLDINTFGSDFDTVLGVYTGTRGSLTSVACNDDSGSLQSSVSFTASAETAYHIQVASYSSGGGTLELNADFTAFPPPINDIMADAIVIEAVPYTNMQSTINATLEVDEPETQCGWNNEASVWYRFTPSSSGTFSVDTFGSDYDTVLHVYEDLGGGSLELMGCNDDSVDEQSKAVFSASLGSSYLIGITHYGEGSGGNLVLNLDRLQCPPTALCILVRDALGVGAFYPELSLLDSDDHWVAGGRGDSAGYVVIDPAPSGTYRLVASAWGLFIVDDDIVSPGQFTTTAQGLPDVEISTLDTAGSVIEAQVIMAQSYDGFGYVGHSYVDTPLIVHASPGTYDVTTIANTDRYVLSLEDQVISTAGQSISLDASLMPTDVLTIDWDGFIQGSLGSHAPFTDSYWYWIDVGDGQSVTMSIPEDFYPIWTRAHYDDGATGDIWDFDFYHCCYTTDMGGQSETLTVGGEFTTTVRSVSDNYLPGQTGSLYTWVDDAYENFMVSIWHWDADESSTASSDDLVDDIDRYVDGDNYDKPSRHQEFNCDPRRIPYRHDKYDVISPDEKSVQIDSGGDVTMQGAWESISPDYEVRDVLGTVIPGSLVGTGLFADYDFVIPDPANEGIWEGQATVDYGPYQSPDTDITQFNVLTVAIPNDDIDDATTIDVMPFDTDQIMWAATTADDDPMYPCTGFQHYHSVWFQYTPTANGILFLDTEGSDYDTVLAVWAGTRGALTNIACNDDINLSENLQSLVELATFADTTYYIEVTSYSENPTGTLVLSAEYITPTFVDVPFDHPLHDYIEALYQAGYTAGCSTDPLMYCPEQVM
ncbi:MAG: C1 family peptidase, partial [Anaerolineales bacterium]